MRLYRHSAYRNHKSITRRLVAAFVIAAMSLPFVSAQADVAGRQALSLIDSTVEISESVRSFFSGRQDLQQFPQ